MASIRNIGENIGTLNLGIPGWSGVGMKPENLVAAPVAGDIMNLAHITSILLVEPKPAMIDHYLPRITPDQNLNTLLIPKPLFPYPAEFPPELRSYNLQINLNPHMLDRMRAKNDGPGFVNALSNMVNFTIGAYIRRDLQHSIRTPASLLTAGLETAAAVNAFTSGIGYPTLIMAVSGLLPGIVDHIFKVNHAKALMTDKALQAHYDNIAKDLPNPEDMPFPVFRDIFRALHCKEAGMYLGRTTRLFLADQLVKHLPMLSYQSI